MAISSGQGGGQTALEMAVNELKELNTNTKYLYFLLFLRELFIKIGNCE